MTRSMLLRAGKTLGWVTTVGMLGLAGTLHAQDGQGTDLEGFAAIAGGDAVAQADGDGRATEPTFKPPVGIEQIIVNARKREEALQSTPISAVVLGSEELAARQVSNVTDIGEAVPNLNFDVGNGTNQQTRIYIRGVGQDDGRSNSDPGVGLYVDGVYFPRLAGSAVSVLDIDNIQVLRGPQGTLFGKNTVGGVIDIRTRKPEPEFGGLGLVRYGSFGRFETQATVNVPLIPERLLTRFTFETQTDEGYTRNRVTDSKTGDNKLLKGRFALRFLPTDFVAIDLAYEQTREDEKVPTTECRIGQPYAPGRLLLDNFTSNFIGACISDRADGSELTTGSDADGKNDLDTQFLHGTVTWDFDTFTLKSISSWRRVENRGKNLELDLSPISGIAIDTGSDQNDTISQEFQFLGRAFDDRLTYTAGVYGLREKGHSRATLSSFQDTLTQIRLGQDVIIPGVIVDADTVATANLVQALNPGLNLNIPAVGSPLTLSFFDALGGQLARAQALLQGRDPNRESLTDLTDTFFLANSTGVDRFETLSLASFAEGTFSLTDKLSVTGGLRLTRERKERQNKRIPLSDAALFAMGLDANQILVASPQEDRFDKWSGRVQLEYQATDSVFAYATYGRGYKSGGFNTDPLSDPLSPPDESTFKFDEETLDSYEIGLKTQWFDNRLVVNLAAFYNDYEDIQLTSIQIDQNGFPVGQINNAAEATVKGLELDFQARPTPPLTISGGIGFTDSDYDDFFAREDAGTNLSRMPPTGLNQMPVDLSQCTALNGPSCPSSSNFIAVAGTALRPFNNLQLQDFSDFDRTNTPNFNANISVDYMFDLATWGALTARLTYFFQGDVEYVTFNDDDVSQNGFGLLNSRLTWDLWDGDTVLAVFGRNLLDRRYINGGVNLADTGGAKAVFFGPPRSFGVELYRRF